MTETADPPKNSVEVWLKTIQVLGFPIVACVAVGLVYDSAIKWERGKMLPALEANAKALDTNSEVLRGFSMTIQKLPDQFRAEFEKEREQRKTDP